MSQNTDLTYYQKTRDVMLNKAKDYCKNNKERLWEQARDKYRNLSEEKKMKKENMGKIDTTICLKKKIKTKRISKKIIERQKSLYIIMGKMMLIIIQIE